MSLRPLPFLVITTLLLGCTHAEDTPPPVRPVLAMTVSAGNAADAAVYSGEVRARHEADIGFRIPGKLTARLVDVGATVKQGQALARIDPSDSQSSAEASRAAVTAAETDHKLAAAELERYRALADKGFVGKSVLDQRVATADAARARLDQAQAQLALSRNQLGYTTLTASSNGVVTAVLAEAGQVVAAGQPVVRIARPEEREVLVSIPEARLAATRSARDIRIRLLSDPGKTYQGRLRELSPNADPLTRTFAARISILGADAGVALGMTANVAFSGTGGPAMQLPLAAVTQADGKATVWVVDQASMTVSPRAVTAGAFREDTVAVLAGLQTGETVVTAGVNKLVAGQKVRISPDSAVTPATSVTPAAPAAAATKAAP